MVGAISRGLKCCGYILQPLCSSVTEAVKEAKESAAEHFEIEKHNLLARNQRLENEVKSLKSLLSSDEEGSSSRPRMLSGLSDAVVGAIRRNTATSDSSSVDGEAVADNVKSLEKSMEKVSGGPRHVYVAGQFVP